MYEYRARITRVIDGDTVEAEIDLGFHVTFTATLRLTGINAPETRGTERPQGLASTRYLESLLDELTGENREAVENSPHLEIFKSKGYEVLILTDSVDEIWLGVTHEFEEKKLQSAARGDLNLCFAFS